VASRVTITCLLVSFVSLKYHKTWCQPLNDVYIQNLIEIYVLNLGSKLRHQVQITGYKFDDTGLWKVTISAPNSLFQQISPAQISKAIEDLEGCLLRDHQIRALLAFAKTSGKS